MGFSEVMFQKRRFVIGAHVKVPKIASSVSITDEFCQHAVKVCQIDAMHLSSLPEFEPFVMGFQYCINDLYDKNKPTIIESTC